MFDIAGINESLTISQTTIVQLGNENASLAAGKKQCEAELSSLRCDTNKYLETVRQSEADSYKKLLQAGVIFNNNKNLISTFISDKKITCSNAEVAA